MNCAAGRSLVDPSNVVAVLAGDAIGVAFFDSVLESAPKRLYGRAPAEVLLTLTFGGCDAAGLLLDVRHAG